MEKTLPLILQQNKVNLIKQGLISKITVSFMLTFISAVNSGGDGLDSDKLRMVRLHRAIWQYIIIDSRGFQHQHGKLLLNR